MALQQEGLAIMSRVNQRLECWQPQEGDMSLERVDLFNKGNSGTGK